MRKLRNLFQSTRPVRGATLQVCPSASYSVISIHAPRAGRDHNGKCKPAETVGISIHAPRAGRDLAGGALKSFRSGFQSTRPVRGATPKMSMYSTVPSVDFNPRAPCGARPGPTGHRAGVGGISIHAPRAGRDTAPASHCIAGGISIHAPRAGRDHPVQVLVEGHGDFNPRAPCGARLPPLRGQDGRREFQSTRPVRGATVAASGRSFFAPISIHAPRAGRDLLHRVLQVGAGISIHAPRAGRDVDAAAACPSGRISIHAPRAGRDRICTRGQG